MTSCDWPKRVAERSKTSRPSNNVSAAYSPAIGSGLGWSPKPVDMSKEPLAR